MDRAYADYQLFEAWTRCASNLVFGPKLSWTHRDELGLELLDCGASRVFAVADHQIAWRLLRSKLGFRTLMDFIPIRPELVKGSHGCLNEDNQDKPVFICQKHSATSEMKATEVYQTLRDLIFCNKRGGY